MALTKEQFNQLRSKGLSVDQIVAFEGGQKPQVATKEPGALQSVAQGVASPFLKLASSFRSIGEQAGSIINGTDTDAATREYDYGYFGKAKPLGSTGTAKDLLESIGVGAEIGSYAIGGGGASTALKAGLKGKVIKAGLEGLATGSASGGIGSFGSALQEADAQPADVAYKTLFGTALGGITGGILGAATPIAVKGVNGVRTLTNLAKIEEKLAESNRNILKPTATNLADWAEKKVNPIETFTKEFGPEAIPTKNDTLALDDLIAQTDARYKAGSEGFNTILRNSPETMSLSQREVHLRRLLRQAQGASGRWWQPTGQVRV